MTMLDTIQIDFISSCVLMAIGIGLDASIATACQVSQMNTRRFMVFWIAGVTLTHTVFPMLGYMSSYQSLQYFPSITGLIGLLAFLLIVIFLYQEFASLLDTTKDNTYLNPKNFLANIGVLLAVSWDALWSGPAKSAQVIHWTPLAVWLSFVVVGIFIFLMTSATYRLSTVIDITLSRWVYPIKWVQYSVITYFALLAITRYTLNMNLHALLLAITGMAIISALFLMIFLLRVRPIKHY